MEPDKRIGAREAKYAELKNHPFFKGINFEIIHTQTPPTLKPYPTKLIFDDDMGVKKMQEEESEKWY